MPNSNKRLSIIIPTWNTASVTLKCYQTIRKYLPIDSTEIIIVDNHSTDETNKIFSKIKDIKLITNDDNLGFAKACNIGASESSGEFLLFLNSDMELVDSSLVEMLNFYQNTPNIGAIGPQFLNPDLSPQGSVFPPQNFLNAFKEYWLKIPNSYSKHQPVSASPLKVWAISGGAILISKSLFQQIGGWNESYHMYFEDLDLCRNLCLHHYDVYFYPLSKVVHHHGVSGRKLATSSDQWRRLIPSAKLYFGFPNYYIINFIIWSGQKLHSFLG